MKSVIRKPLLALVIVATMAVSGCDSPTTAKKSTPPTQSTSATKEPVKEPAQVTPIPEPTPEPPPEPEPPSLPLSGHRIALDPGHNGGNSGASSTVNAKISDGRGGTKSCNTTGTSTNSGYSEHAFAWDVAQKTRAILEAQGATVVMTRDSDTGVGPCVDKRGQFAEENDVELLISIHGDGSTNASHNGFFAIVSSPPLNPAQGEPALRLADEMIKALSANGFVPNSLYRGGLSKRADIAGLNWAARPSVLLELGEMRNAGDAAVMESEEGRQRYAEAMVSGIHGWLGLPYGMAS